VHASAGNIRGTRGRGGRSSRGGDETIIFDPPPRRGGGGRRSSEGEPPGGSRVRLVDLSSDWLSMIVAIRSSTDGRLDANLIRNRTLELKGRLEQDGARQGTMAADVEAAVFALVVFLDETALRAGGPLRDAWVARPLQLEWFGTNTGGDEFFSRLDGMRRERENRIEAIEVYACCLAFGFLGRFGLSGPERVKSLLTEVERDIAAVRGTGRRALAPHAARPDDQGVEVAGRFPLWLALAVFVPALVLVFLLLKLGAVIGARGAAGAIARMAGGGS
jgi:type VI secretion system protein ImpK